MYFIHFYKVCTTFKVLKYLKPFTVKALRGVEYPYDLYLSHSGYPVASDFNTPYSEILLNPLIMRIIGVLTRVTTGSSGLSIPKPLLGYPVVYIS